jgi:signal transduction histidine kinase
LGLAISRWIAEAHHGELKLGSSNEKGSVFLATLRAASPEGPEPVSLTAEPH